MMFWIAMIVIIISLVFAYTAVKERCDNWPERIFMFVLCFIASILIILILAAICAGMYHLWGLS